MNVTNGDRPRVVIPNLFDGEGGRQGDRIAIKIGASGVFARGKQATVDGQAVRIVSAEAIRTLPGWWTIGVEHVGN